MSISILRILKAEWHKQQSSVAIWIMLLYPIFTSLFFGIYLSFQDVYNEVHPWFLFDKVLLLYSLFTPIVIALYVFQYCDIEVQCKKYRCLFTLPLRIWQLYTAKLVTLFWVISLSSFMAYLSFLLLGKLMSVAHPALAYDAYDFRLVNAVFFLKFYFISITIAIIQYVLSLIYPKAIFVIAWSGFFTVFGLVGSNWEHIIYNPYAGILLSFKGYFGEVTQLNDVYILCLPLYSIVAIIIGYVLFKRERLK